MSTDEGGDKTLDVYFNATMTKVRELQETPLHRLSMEYEHLFRTTLEFVSQSLVTVQNEGIFSTGELIDDIKTSDIPFLGLNMTLATVLEHAPINPEKMSVKSRVAIAALAVRKYVEFMWYMEEFDVFINVKDYRSMIEEALPEGVMGRFNVKAINSNDNNDRQSKLEKFKKLRSLESRYLGEKERIERENDTDEESLRNLSLQLLELNVAQSLDSARSVLSEITMLSGMMTDKSSHRQSTALVVPYVAPNVIPAYVRKLQDTVDGDNNFDDIREKQKDREEALTKQRAKRVEAELDPVEMMKSKNKILGPNGEVKQPFTIMPAGSGSTRTDALNGVFGTGQKLPTVSLDQLVEKELANMQKPTAPKNEDEDEDTYQKADEETMKARRWDEFTEANPKGSGNTLNLG